MLRTTTQHHPRSCSDYETPKRRWHPWPCYFFSRALVPNCYSGPTSRITKTHTVPGCHLHAWVLEQLHAFPSQKMEVSRWIKKTCYPILPNSCYTVEEVVGYLNSAQTPCQELFGRLRFFPEPLPQAIISNLQVTKCLSKKSNKLYEWQLKSLTRRKLQVPLVLHQATQLTSTYHLDVMFCCLQTLPSDPNNPWKNKAFHSAPHHSTSKWKRHWELR